MTHEMNNCANCVEKKQVWAVTKDNERVILFCAKNLVDAKRELRKQNLKEFVATLRVATEKDKKSFARRRLQDKIYHFKLTAEMLENVLKDARAKVIRFEQELNELDMQEGGKSNAEEQ